MKMLKQDQVFFPHRDVAEMEFCFVRLAYEHWDAGAVLHRIPQLHQKIQLVLSGAGTLQTHEKLFQLTAGTILLTAPNSETRIEATSDNGLEFLIIAWTGTQAAALIDELVGQNGIAFSLENTLPIQAIWEEMINEVKQMNSRSDDICYNYLRILLHRIAELSSENKKTSGAFETFMRCRKAIHKQFETLNGPGEVAASCGLEHAYMTRLFKRYAKCTPGHYLNRIKFNKAIHLLTTTDRTIADIAAEMKFTDPYSFSRAFKRVVGVSPRDYKR